ncbi:MAG: LssY C-terminal domain-containing protein [Acidobacteria bacterium]|nr:LssY C-terminal domain-containing protein [Acidobacteriota bacterium]
MRFLSCLLAVFIFGFTLAAQELAQQTSPQASPSTSAAPNTVFNDPDAPQSQPAVPVNSVAPGTASSVTKATTSPATAAAAASARKLVTEVDVPAARDWTDTGIDLNAGERVTISATGNVQPTLGAAIGPAGKARSWNDLMRALPVNAAGTGALIGRIGDDPATVPFLIGAEKDLTVTRAGRLFLGVNRTSQDQVGGNFHAKVQITPVAAAGTSPKGAATDAAPGLDPSFLSRIPRRVNDAAGKPGDVVNFIILGPQEKMQQAFQAAGWTLVDRTKADAVLHAVLSSTSKQAYTEMPMSELYLFKRPQDFGYARAEPVQVVASRHHLRVWKAPFDVDGRTVWAGAATHDIGFEKDQRTGGVTHKIDPELDQERDFLAACFRDTGTVSSVSYLTPADPVHEAQTATGGSFHTDGRVLVLVLSQN